MTGDTFNEALLRFGAALERWPEAEREAALARIAEDPAAAKALADFKAFERTLSEAVRPPPFGAAEIGRVLGALETSDSTWRPSKRFWMFGVGASALSFAAGAAAMLLTLPSTDTLLLAMGLAAGQGDIGGLL